MSRTALVAAALLLAAGCGRDIRPTTPVPMSSTESTTPSAASVASLPSPSSRFSTPVRASRQRSGRPAISLGAMWTNPRLGLHVPILMYHVIGNGSDGPRHLPGLIVPTRAFIDQLSALHTAGWKTITMAGLAADLVGGRTPPRRTFVITVDDGHIDGLTVALPILKHFGYDATFYIVVHRLGHRGYLTREQVVRLAVAGMEIGNHTVHHLDLAILPKPEVIAEIEGAERALAKLVGYPPVTFDYPSGEEDPSVVRAVGSAGLDLAVTTQFGALETYPNRLALPRVRVFPQTTGKDVLSTLRNLTG